MDRWKAHIDILDLSLTHPKDDFIPVMAMSKDDSIRAA
jgi:hypothetical protein